MTKQEVKKDLGKKIGAGALAVATAASLGFGISENSQNHDLAQDLSEKAMALEVQNQEVLDLQEQLGDFEERLDNGDLIRKEEVDLTVDNEAAVVEALKEQAEQSESLVFDEESKSLLVSPKVLGEEELSGFVVDDLELGDSVELSIKNRDLDKLFKGDVSFDGEKFKAEEQIKLDSDVKVAFSGSSEFSKSFEAIPHLAAMSRDSIVREFKFKEMPDFEKVSREKPIVINFLGKDLSITSFDGEELEFMMGEELALKGLEQIEVEGKVVKMLSCSDEAVIIEVAGDSAIVKEGNSKQVGGLSVSLMEVFNKESIEDSMAVMVIGSESFKKVSSGDELEEDESWKWLLEENKISIELDEVLNEADEALAPGNVLNVPGDVEVEIVPVENEMEEVNLKFDQEEIDGELDEPVVLLSTGSADGLLVDIDEDSLYVDELFISESGAFVKDDDNEFVEAAGIKLSESELELSGSEECEGLLIDDICIGVNIAEGKFNKLEVGEMDVSSREEDTLNRFGIILSGVDDLEDADELNLSVPEEKAEVKLRVA